MSLDGMPINQRSHAHGQGWADLNPLIPELISSIHYRKGPYYAADGDFANAGSANIYYADKIDRGLASFGLGKNGFYRTLLSDAPKGALAVAQAHLLRDPRGKPVPMRMGIAAGPVVAGVVGARRFFYDVWGDAVNVASRMESTDIEGRIQVPQNVFERLQHAFVLEERGEIDIKGKGAMRTWFLVGRAPAPTGADSKADSAVILEALGMETPAR
jgi:hypothetical protein